MTLKKIMASDVQDLFFNLDDFAETHEVEGAEIDIVIDRDELQKKKIELGITEGDILFYARKDDLPKRKSPGAFINLDGREYILVDWVENLGVSCLTLKQNRSV